MITLLALAVLAKSETVVIDGVLTAVEGNVVSVAGAGRTLRGLAGPKTRFWRVGATSALPKFAINETVRARFRVDEAGVELRELSDPGSAEMLDAVRTRYLPATVKKTDSAGWILTLANGAEHFYRKVPSTRLDRGVLKEGDKIWARGRMLASLDTVLVHASDVAPPQGPGSAGGTAPSPKPTPTPRPIGDGGMVDVKIVAIIAGMPMFDVDYDGRTYHVTYDASTVFRYERRSVRFGENWLRANVRMRFRRDRFNRILAMRVDWL